jgi:hypothetical protein
MAGSHQAVQYGAAFRLYRLWQARRRCQAGLPLGQVGPHQRLLIGVPTAPPILFGQ